MTTPAISTIMDDVRGFYESLKASAVRDSKRRSLDTLWAVLEDMRASNVKEFTVSEVGRRSEKAGGPKTQSIRNEGGKDFRDLIEAYAMSAGKAVQRVAKGDRTQIDIALDAVQEPGMRAVFKQVVAENKLLKHQNDELRSAFKALSVSAASERTESGPSVEGEIIPPRQAHADLTSSEMESLRRSIDPDRLAENGWDVQPNGAIIDDSGTTILPPSFAFAIRKICR